MTPHWTSPPPLAGPNIPPLLLLQAKALLTFVEAAADKSLRCTVALTAGRGRGKSAAIG